MKRALNERIFPKKKMGSWNKQVRNPETSSKLNTTTKISKEINNLQLHFL